MKTIIPILTIAMLYSSIATAEVYKWRDENGRLHFSDTPPVTAQDTEKFTVKDNRATGIPQGLKTDITVNQTKQIESRVNKSKKSQPSRISAKSYQISKNIETKGDYVIISGRIGSGPRCEYLKIEAFAINENGRRAHATDITSIGSSNGSALFNAKDRVYGLEGDRTDWDITSFYVTCSD